MAKKSSKNPKYLVVFIVTILVVGVVYLLLSINNTTTKVSGNIPNIEQALSNTSTWTEETATSYREGFGAGEYDMSFKVPPNWSVVNNTDTDGCISYTIESKNYGMLRIEEWCEGWGATYYPIPEDAVIVKSAFEVGNDGHDNYVIRFMANSNKEYRYVDVAVGRGEKATFDEKMSDKFFGTAPILLDITYIGNPSGENLEEGLQLADTVVNSIELSSIRSL